jgi:hypothetical protein
MSIFTAEVLEHKKAERFSGKTRPPGLQKKQKTNMSKKIEPCLKGYGVAIYKNIPKS